MTRFGLRRLVTVVVGTTLASGCAEGPNRTAEPMSVRDSAGLRVVENVENQWPGGVPWEVSADPIWTTGAEGDGGITFGRIDGVARLSNGTVVVADGLGGRIHFISGAGEVRSTLGGLGDGPDEFRSIGGLSATTDDSVRIFDSWRRRIAVLSPDGEFSRAVPVPTTLESPLLVPVGWTDNGAALLLGMPTPPEPGYGPAPMQSPLFLISPDADGFERIGEVESGFVATDATGISIPIFPRPQGFIATADRQIWTSSIDGFEVTRRDRGGQPTLVARLNRESQEVSAAAREALAAAQRTRMEAVGLTEMPDAIIRSVAPQVAGLLADPTGYVWVREAEALADPVDTEKWLVAAPIGTNRWTVLSSEGAWIGTLELPHQFDLRAVDGEFLVGVLRDDLGIELPALYGLSRGSD